MKSSSPETPELLPLINWMLFLLGSVNLIFGTWSVIQNNATSSTIGLTAGLLLLLAASIDRFEILKGLGIEARTRKLDQKIIEVEELLSRMRELAEMSGATLIDQSTKIGRWGGAPLPSSQYELVTRVKSNLLKLGTTQEEIEKIIRPWIRITLSDLSRAISAKYNEATDQVVRDAERAKNQFGSSISAENFEAHSSAAREWSELLDYRNSLYKNGFDINDFPGSLALYYKDFPKLPSAVKSAVVDEIESWRAEIDFLKKHGDLNSKERWFNVLGQGR